MPLKKYQLMFVCMKWWICKCVLYLICFKGDHVWEGRLLAALGLDPHPSGLPTGRWRGSPGGARHLSCRLCNSRWRKLSFTSCLPRRGQRGETPPWFIHVKLTTIERWLHCLLPHSFSRRGACRLPHATAVPNDAQSFCNHTRGNRTRLVD